MKCKKCNQVCFAKNIDNKAVSNCCSAEIDYTDYSQDQMQGCWHNYPTSGSVTGYPHGMSLRDYFAAKAMQALISAGEFIIDSDEDIEMPDGKVLKKVTRPRIQGTETAFKFADAMLEAREK